MLVKFYASIRQAAGTKMMDIDVGSGMTINDVLMEVTHHYPELDKLIWKAGGGLSEHAHVFINGENITRLAGLETKVSGQDHVDIFPPLVGGNPKVE